MYYKKDEKFIYNENLSAELAEFEYCKFSLANIASQIRFKNIIPKLKKIYAQENLY